MRAFTHDDDERENLCPAFHPVNNECIKIILRFKWCMSAPRSGINEISDAIVER